jgi:hypothetical protein
VGERRGSVSTIYRQYLVWDRGISKPNTFFYIPKLESIRCRIRVSSADEVSPVDVHLRFRKRAAAPGLVFCRPLDETTFVTAAEILHPDLPKLELLLSNVPDGPAAEMRAL